MVAQTIALPNIRKFFVPDPGMIIADVDLSGADAQVVAWEAEDEDLKAAFRRGLKVHAENAKLMFEGLAGSDGKKEPYYSQCKQGVHATNYGASARTIAATLGWTVHRADGFQQKWFGAHPGIKSWHERIEKQLYETRSVSNRFGYRIVYFDRVAGLLPEALAWIPQSTVALNCILGALNLDEQLPWCEILLQVHDSLVLQFPVSRLPQITEIRELLHITTPYDDPLEIPWSLSLSRTSWGDCQSISWEEALAA